MKTCSRCRQAVEEDVSYCPQCGHAFPDAVSERVNSLLTEANLLRIRGEYEAAAQKCTEALRLQPDNAETHSVLGDIYESREDLHEAEKWYQMANELNPDSKVDVAKLENVKRRIEKAGRDDPPIVTGNWPHTPQPRSKLDDTLRYVILFSVIIVAVLLASGFLAWALLGRSESHEKPPEEVIRPESPPAPNPYSYNLATPAEPAPTIPRPTYEQHILSNMAINSALLTRKILVEDVAFDPRTALLIVTYKGSSGVTGLNRLSVLRDSMAVASAAYTSGTGIQNVSVRAIMNFAAEGGAVEPHLVFVGDADQAITEVNVDHMDEAEILKLTSNVWWAAEVLE